MLSSVRGGSYKYRGPDRPTPLSSRLLSEQHWTVRWLGHPLVTALPKDRSFPTERVVGPRLGKRRPSAPCPRQLKLALLCKAAERVPPEERLRSDGPLSRLATIGLPCCAGAEVPTVLVRSTPQRVGHHCLPCSARQPRGFPGGALVLRWSSRQVGNHRAPLLCRG